MSDYRLIMLSAMYENGGNTTHRMLDGHPQLDVYPVESQLGTRQCNDWLVSTVPFRYRWPEFPLNGDAAGDYEAFYDEELKTLLRVPNRSKFRHADFQMDEAERKRRFVEIAGEGPRTRGRLVEAFFRSTFETWTNKARSGQEVAALGYSPVIVLDTPRILADMPRSHVIHVVRNPWSGYADTIKRPFPLSLERYALTWAWCQHLALIYRDRYPDRFHLLRFEDMVADPKQALGGLCERLGLDWSDACLKPSWNATVMEEVYPWGTIRVPTTEANLATRDELSAEQRADIASLTSVMIDQLDYRSLA